MIKVLNYKYGILQVKRNTKILYYHILNSILIRPIGILLVFDLTNENSFLNIKKWLNEIKLHSNSNVIIFLIGNKLDLESE